MAELIVASRPKTDPSMLWPSVAIQVGEEFLRAGPRGTEWWFDNPFQLSYVLAEPTPDPHHEHIRKQVARLAAVEPGWLDGAGDRCDQQGLKRLEAQLIRYYPRTAPELLLSPTEDGDAFAEWWLGDHIPSLEIFLDGSPAVVARFRYRNANQHRARTGSERPTGLGVDSKPAAVLPAISPATLLLRQVNPTFCPRRNAPVTGVLGNQGARVRALRG